MLYNSGMRRGYATEVTSGPFGRGSYEIPVPTPGKRQPSAGPLARMSATEKSRTRGVATARPTSGRNLPRTNAGNPRKRKAHAPKGPRQSQVDLRAWRTGTIEF